MVSGRHGSPRSHQFRGWLIFVGAFFVMVGLGMALTSF
jgi:hypothetical protein